jgi:hypothetical protein
MISLVACSCGSSENLIRQALHKYKYKNWAMEPIKKGKTASLTEVERLIRKFPDDLGLKGLYSHINNTGKWCVIIGYNNDSVRWADISHNDMKSDVDAECIIEDFS